MGKDNSIYAASASLGKLPRVRMVWKVLGGVVLLIIIYVIYAIFVDESLDPGLVEYYRHKSAPVSDKENAAIYIRALDAPLGADLLSFGQEDVRMESKAAHNLDTSYDQRKVDNELSVHGSLSGFECLENRLDTGKSSEQCITTSELRELIGNNAELLRRYEVILRLPAYRGSAARDVMMFLDVAKLYALALELDLRNGRFEDAYRKWTVQQRFIDNVRSAETRMVDKAILLVIQGFSFSSLDQILAIAPQMASTHGDEMIALLRPAAVKAWNIHAALVEFYDEMNITLSVELPTRAFHPNFIRNRLYRESHNIENAIDNGEPRDYSEKVASISRQYGDGASWSNDYLRDPLNTFPSRMVYCKSLKVLGNMAVNMVTKDDVARLLVLVIKAKRQHVADDQLAAFIERNGRGMRDSVAGSPITVDAADHTLGYGDQEKKPWFRVHI